MHALAVHAAVVFAPLAAIAGIAFLVVKWRNALRWPLVGLAAIAAAAAFVAKESGEILEVALGDQLSGNGNITGELVARHEELGGRLWLALLLLLAASIAAALTFRTDAGGRGHILPATLTVVAITVLGLTYQTGEAGAKARWNPDGSFDYSGE